MPPGQVQRLVRRLRLLVIRRTLLAQVEGIEVTLGIRRAHRSKLVSRYGCKLDTSGGIRLQRAESNRRQVTFGANLLRWRDVEMIAVAHVFLRLPNSYFFGLYIHPCTLVNAPAAATSRGPQLPASGLRRIGHLVASALTDARCSVSTLAKNAESRRATPPSTVRR